MDTKAFKKIVYTHHASRGRHALPWRPGALFVRKDGSIDPYKVLVSEVMLQQTQVARVIPKYKVWMKKFPNIRTLAQASLQDVLLLWQGLGYSRRAKGLWMLAKKVSTEYGGVIPNNERDLISLPGIGEYTANAVLAFAYNQPATLVETNIRTAIIHHYFLNKKDISDMEIKQVLDKVVDRKNPRTWYYALMDYGAYLKEQGISYNAKSKHYTKQTKFEGSARQVRGEILKALGVGSKSISGVVKTLQHRQVALVQEKINELLKEKLISKTGSLLRLG